MGSQRLGLASVSCLLVLTCTFPVRAEQIFVDGFEAGTACASWSASAGLISRCNGMDNDCDGSVDYGCECDPLLQNCPNSGDACFIRSFTGPSKTLCAPPSTGDPMEPPGGQDEECMFANGCQKGYHCALVDPVSFDHLDCAFGCRPEGGEPSCATGATTSHQCFEILTYYSNAEGFPPDIGICVPPPP